MKFEFSCPATTLKQNTTVPKIRAFCQTLKAGELLSSKQMREHVGCGSTSVDRHMQSEELAGFNCLYRGGRWWGSAATIKQAKRMLAKNEELT